MRFRSFLALPALLVAATSVHAQAAQDQDAVRQSLIKMKSDLRNLIVAQEAYFADHSAYAAEMSGLRFRNSENVSVRLTATQNNSWGAEARSAELPNVACVVWINLKEQDRPKVGGESIAKNEGEPACAEIKKP